jgi:hypothetical protein
LNQLPQEDNESLKDPSKFIRRGSIGPPVPHIRVSSPEEANQQSKAFVPPSMKRFSSEADLKSVSTIIIFYYKFVPYLLILIRYFKSALSSISVIDLLVVFLDHQSQLSLPENLQSHPENLQSLPENLQSHPENRAMNWISFVKKGVCWKRNEGD